MWAAWQKCARKSVENKFLPSHVRILISFITAAGGSGAVQSYENPFRSSNHPSERMHSSASSLSISRLFFQLIRNAKNFPSLLGDSKTDDDFSKSLEHAPYISSSPTHKTLPSTLKPLLEQILQLNYGNFSQNINFIPRQGDEGRSSYPQDMWLLSSSAENFIVGRPDQRAGRRGEGS